MPRYEPRRASAILTTVLLLAAAASHAATAALWETTTLPTAPVDSDTAAVELGVRFSSSVAGTVGATRFYRGAAIDSGYTANLWSANGTWRSSNYCVTPVVTIPDTPPVGIPSKPSNVSAEGIAASNIELRWYASSIGSGEVQQVVPSYVITRDGATIATVDRAGLTELYFRDTGLPGMLTPDTTYTYTVAGRTAAGVVGPASQPVTVRTPGEANRQSDARISLFHPHTDPSYESPMSSPIELGCRIRIDQGGGYLTGLRVYQASGALGQLTGRLWTTSGALVATTATITVTDSFGWRELPFAAPIAADGTYIVSYTSPTGAYAFTPEFFDSRFQGGMVVGPLQAEGCSSGAPGTFPGTAIGDSNIFVDAIWSPFSDSRVSLWNSTARPEIAAATVDPSPVELGVRFTPTADGTVSQIRFFRGAATAGGYLVRLWSEDGIQLASAAVSDGSIPGWQVGAFAPVTVEAGRTYTASYYASSGAYAIDQDSFFATMTEGALSAPGGVNGVFHYGVGGGFPDETWDASNYWVDPVLVPIIAPSAAN